MSILKSLVSLLMIITSLVSSTGLGHVSPYLSVIPDTIKVGLDYISLNYNDKAISAKELKNNLYNKKDVQHPFVLAQKNDFQKIKNALSKMNSDNYISALNSYTIQNADALLNKEIFPLLSYELDEEDSILPISREVFNRLVILGYAWQITSKEKYAQRAADELQNICSFKDWCPSHFLAAAEMALAASLGYDWFFDYLSPELKQALAEKTYSYAIKPALSKNYIKNWFTWSKNNWNSICYSGIGIASMTFASFYPNEASKFLHMCYQNMPIAFESFTPDGVYAEGSGYFSSGMNAIVYFISTSQNFFSTDFGLSEIDGFKQLGYFPVYITTPTGVFNFGDNKNRKEFSPALQWYASKYDSELIAYYQMQNAPNEFYPNLSSSTERNGSGKETALCCLWYNPKNASPNFSFSKQDLSVCLKSDVGQDLVLMRSAYFDSNAVFAGIKGGYNYLNHGDLDIGSFVFEAVGERWAEELGPGRYDAPDYFVDLPAGGRWKNYAKRAEGQNTLVINPKMTLDDQYALAKGSFTFFESNNNGGKCILDMSQAYKQNGAKKVERSFSVENNFSVLHICDKIKCLFPSEIYWFMHTKADIEILQGGKTAILSQNGKKIKATLYGDGEFSVMSAVALKGKYEYDDDYPDLKKLTVYLKGKRNASIDIKLSVLI